MKHTTAKIKGSTPPIIRPHKQRPTDSKRQRRAKAKAKLMRAVRDFMAAVEGSK